MDRALTLTLTLALTLTLTLTLALTLTLTLTRWNMVKGHVQDMRLRFGLLIEAQADEEMPEQMLACAYVSCLSSAACPLVPEQVLREAVYEGNSMAC